MKLNSRYDAELGALQKALEDMMSLDLECLKAIVTALDTQELAKVACIRELATEIDRAERNIETLCLRLLLMRHPVASDLRRVSGALKMITDLQRIGHQCCDFADILTADGEPLKSHLPRLSQIADQVVEMLEGAIAACVHGDALIACCVARSDNEVDVAYSLLRSSLAAEIRNPRQDGTDRLLDVLMLGKYLERMADHIVLFVRWIVFVANGNDAEDLPEDADELIDGKD